MFNSLRRVGALHTKILPALVASKTGACSSTHCGMMRCQECGRSPCVVRAGVTVFNSLRRVGALQGATVAVNAIGGLGHLGIQVGWMVCRLGGSM